MDLKARAQQLKRDIPAVYLCLKSPQTPLSAKVFAGLAVAYALSPIDLIPDFIPVLGMLDDLLLLPALVALAIRKIPPALLAEKRAEAAALWADGKPKSWKFALPILLFWAIIALVVVKAIWL